MKRDSSTSEEDESEQTKQSSEVVVVSENEKVSVKENKDLTQFIQESPEKLPVTQDQKLIDFVRQFTISDKRIGFPIQKPNIAQLTHGWFWSSNTDVIETIGGEHTRES